MLPLLRALELNLVVEQGGYSAAVSGADGNFLVVFPTLASLWHFAIAAWPLRRPVPAGITVKVAWRRFHWEVLHGTPT